MSDQTRVYAKTPPAKSTQLEANKGLLQRSATRTEKPSAIPPIVHEVLKSPGQPLEASTRAFMEPRFGHDFSRVRVHTDARAAESAREVNASAYTMGNDLVFDTGMYAPHTARGKSLLAHELTHVVQTNRHPGPFGESIAPENHSSEKEADLAARGISFGVSANPGGVMQRKVTVLEKAAQIEMAEQSDVIPSECYEQLKKELWDPKFIEGVLAGAAKDIWDSFKAPIELANQELTSLFHLGFGGYYKAKLQNFMKIKSLMNALYEFVKVVVKDPDFLVAIAHDLRKELGIMTKKWCAKDFMSTSSYSKGKIVGTILVEILLLFFGPAKLAKAAKGTRLGKVILETMEKIPFLKKLLEARNLSVTRREALNLSEKSAMIAEKEAEHLVLTSEKEASHAVPELEKYSGTHGPPSPSKTGEPPLTSKMSEPQVKKPSTPAPDGQEHFPSETLAPANRESISKVDVTQSQASPTVKQNEADIKQPMSSVKQSEGHVSKGTGEASKKFSEMSAEEQLAIAKHYAQRAPIEIPENANMKAKSMNAGYEQITYTWNDGTHKYEVRWHTRTPGAPIDQGNTWVIQRKVPGNGGQQPQTFYKIGENEWVEGYKWFNAIDARKAGTATPEQVRILDQGHWKE
ncbi:DUF4157 domain-containing protein [Paenibacillus alvei]|uniref:eCIS core domain-containing protein n=1 Tax=Paenibacillus alvei TaxID=44250 RepID=A0A383RA87_PAEAL|nr:DUF4157 domain-containing protein [Paenibacillus alvei]SYX84025.1 protein of unknown function [Paenibacillus alvei]